MPPSVVLCVRFSPVEAKYRVAVVERWPLRRGLSKSKCMDCPPGQNKVAVVERWPLVEVRLYYFVFAFFRRVKANGKRTRRIEPQLLDWFALAVALLKNAEKYRPLCRLIGCYLLTTFFSIIHGLWPFRFESWPSKNSLGPVNMSGPCPKIEPWGLKNRCLDWQPYKISREYTMPSGNFSKSSWLFYHATGENELRDRIPHTWLFRWKLYELSSWFCFILRGYFKDPFLLVG